METNPDLDPNREATSTTSDTSSSDACASARREAFVERIFAATNAAFDVFTINLGHRLGFYATLAEHGPLAPPELATRTETHVRYVREWLEQQTVAGILEVEDAALAADARRYLLPAGHDEVLADRNSLYFLAPLAQTAVGAIHPLEAIVDAYRTGAGVSFGDYGSDLCLGQSAMNRPAFLKLLGREWLPRVPDLHKRLVAGPEPRIADVGCGTGWSAIGMAGSYPRVRVDGIDPDESSIDLARTNAELEGLDDRVRFHLMDAADFDGAGQYDLVTAFECLHDMSNPVEVLASMRRLCREDGTVMIMDERVGDAFSGETSPVERMLYGFSVLHCLPVGMAEQPSAATGTVMRTDTLRGYARAAGFSGVEILPIENDFFRFYRLVL